MTMMSLARPAYRDSSCYHKNFKSWSLAFSHHFPDCGVLSGVDDWSAVLYYGILVM